MPGDSDNAIDQPVEPQSLSEMREELGRTAHTVQADERWSHWRPLIDVPAVVAFVLLLAFLLAPPGSSRLPELPVDGIAPTTLRAERGILVEDEHSTALRRAAAEAAVPVVFDYDSELYFALGDTVFTAFSRMRQRAGDESLTRADRLGLFEQELGVAVKPAIFPLLEELKDPTDGAIAINFFLNMGLDRMIVADRGDLPHQRPMQIRDGVLGIASELRHSGGVIDLRQLHRLMRARAGDAPYGSARNVRTWILETAQDLAGANLKRNDLATEEMRKAAVEAVPPVFLRIEAGEVLVRKGDRVTKAVQEKARLLNASSEARTLWGETLAVAGLLTVIMVLGGIFFSRGRVPHAFGRKAAYLTLTVAGTTAAVSVAMFYAGLGLAEVMGFDGTAAAYFVPLALGTVMVSVLVDARTSLMVGIALTLFLAFRVNGDVSLVTYYIVGVLVAGAAARHSRRRLDLLKTGVAVALAQVAVFPVTVILSGQAFGTEHMPYLIAALISGALVGVGSLGLMPVLELIFDESTDPRLLELASADSPLLKELALKAPGTYYHSTMVANLAEAGADAIEANGLMCRVMALYHDIGKIQWPSYFAENQREGDNIHDRLPPAVSAQVVFAHIRDGIDIAQRARLGRAILDGITQHQGTTLLRAFYEKARAQGYNGPEEDYRYPGPRPRRRETGILLLADSTEAATRALKDPSPAAVRERVRTIIAERVADGQLDQCGLTLGDLATLEETFARTLSLGAFHNRIDYPPVGRTATGGGHRHESRLASHDRRGGLADRSA